MVVDAIYAEWGLFNRSFYKDSISILYSECNGTDYENHYEYISHINLKLETYLTIDEVK